MRVITRGVIDWATLEVLEEESFEYEGPVAHAKSGGNAPQPVDPYQQAAAQYGLNTGTAAFNAGLNRTNQVNPLGTTGWDVTGYSTAGVGGGGVGPTGGSAPPMATGGMGLGGSGIPFQRSGDTAAPTGQTYPTSYGQPYGLGGSGDPYASSLSGVGTGAPVYTQQTQLAPQFQSVLQQPIDTSQVPGMPGGPSLQQNVGAAENAAWGQQMNFLQPQEQMQSEQLNSQLAAEGDMPGSAAYNNAETLLGNQQSLENTQAADQAVTTGLGELPMFYGLGSTDLQNQLAERGGIINEFNALNPGGGAQVGASPTDISNAFAQQYQGQLAGYNANTATNNANTEALSSAAMMALLFMSDRKAKTDIEKVGELPQGPGVYRYRYKDRDEPEIGLIAQDVEKTHPHAVFNLGGTKFVNYGAI